MQILLGIALAKEFAREANELGGIFETPHTTVSIKIRAYAHMLGTHHAHHVMQMLERIQYGGFAFLAEKTVIESDLCHSSLGGQCLHLVVCEVARMVAQRPTAAVAAHDGGGTQLKCIIEGRLCCMAHIHHHAQCVHPANHLAPEGTQPAMLCIAACRVADIIVPVVAKRHIHDSEAAEIVEKSQVVTDGISVFNAAHDGFDTPRFEPGDVIRRAGQLYQVGICVGESLYLPQLLLCQCQRLAVSLVGALSLRDISHHDGGIQTAVCHLGQIDQHTTGARGEHVVYIVLTVPEEHGCIAMAVQCDGAGMYLLGLTEEGGFLHEPLKESVHSRLTLAGEEGFGMPLDTQDGLELRALHCLDDAI